MFTISRLKRLWPIVLLVVMLMASLRFLQPLQRPADCPQGPILTVNPGGRLGNKICQYLTVWEQYLRLGDADVRVLPPMEEKLNRHFKERRQVAPLAAHCADAIPWTEVPLGDETAFGARLRAGESLLITGGPCPISRFYALREGALAQLRWRENVTREARRRLALAPAGTRTYVGVHVRRGDYSEWLAWRMGGHLVSPAYLRCALRHARRTYPRPVFLVASDDMPWCRANIAAAADVLFVGSDDSEAYDMATLGLCNHSIVTYGTFGHVSALFAGGDVVVPTGYATTQYFLLPELYAAGVDVTEILDSDDC